VQSSNDGYAIGWLNGSIGITYNSLNKTDSAVFFLSKAQDHLELLPDEKQSLVLVYNNMAEAYQRKKEWSHAIYVLEKAEGIENQVTGKLRKVYLDTYQLFQSVYSRQKNTAQVKHYQRKYQVIQAQLDHIENLAEIVQLRNQVKVKDQQNFLSEQRH
jgi:tetratricopeptide (TPR) repeat protein